MCIPSSNPQPAPLRRIWCWEWSQWGGLCRSHQRKRHQLQSGSSHNQWYVDIRMIFAMMILQLLSFFVSLDSPWLYPDGSGESRGEWLHLTWSWPWLWTHFEDGSSCRRDDKLTQLLHQGQGGQGSGRDVSGNWRDEPQGEDRSGRPGQRWLQVHIFTGFTVGKSLWQGLQFLKYPHNTGMAGQKLLLA